MTIIAHKIVDYPNFSGRPAFLCMVLTCGGRGNDYAAYAGIIDLPAGDPMGLTYDSGVSDYPGKYAAGVQRVASSGAKLRPAEAERYFGPLPDGGHWRV